MKEDSRRGDFGARSNLSSILMISFGREMAQLSVLAHGLVDLDTGDVFGAFSRGRAFF